jgi:hypothetical protein
LVFIIITEQSIAMPKIMTATMETSRVHGGRTIPPKPSLSVGLSPTKPRSTADGSEEEPFQRRASTRDVTALQKVEESLDDAGLDNDDDDGNLDSSLCEISPQSSFGIHFYMRSLLSKYESEAEDCIVVNDNMRVHKSEATPFIPRASFDSMQSLSRNNNSISLDRMESDDDDQADDDSRDKEGDLQADGPLLPKWDACKDSVVGVGNVKKNRWGYWGKAPSEPPIVPLANLTGKPPSPIKRDKRIPMPIRMCSLDFVSPAADAVHLPLADSTGKSPCPIIRDTRIRMPIRMCSLDFVSPAADTVDLPLANVTSMSHSPMIRDTCIPMPNRKGSIDFVSPAADTVNLPLANSIGERPPPIIRDKCIFMPSRKGSMDYGLPTISDRNNGVALNGNIRVGEDAGLLIQWRGLNLKLSVGG